MNPSARVTGARRTGGRIMCASRSTHTVFSNFDPYTYVFFRACAVINDRRTEVSDRRHDCRTADTLTSSWIPPSALASLRGRQAALRGPKARPANTISKPGNGILDPLSSELDLGARRFVCPSFSAMLRLSLLSLRNARKA